MEYLCRAQPEHCGEVWVACQLRARQGLGLGTVPVPLPPHLRTVSGLMERGCPTPRKVVGCATGVTARGTDLRRARRSIWRSAGARTRQGETVFHSIPLGPGVPVHL